MSNTNNQMEDNLEKFRGLSVSRKKALARLAARFIRDNPGSADNSRFWRHLSARQVRENANA